MEGLVGCSWGWRFGIHWQRKDEAAKRSFDIHHQKNRKEHSHWKRYSQYLTSCWHFLQREQHIKTGNVFFLLSYIPWKSYRSWSYWPAERNSVISHGKFLDILDNGQTFQPNSWVDLSRLDWWLSCIFLANLSSSSYCIIPYERKRLWCLWNYGG